MLCGECQELYVHFRYVSMFYVCCIGLCTFRVSFVRETSPVCLVQSGECARMRIWYVCYRQDGGSYSSNVFYGIKEENYSFGVCLFLCLTRRNGADRVVSLLCQG